MRMSVAYLGLFWLVLPAAAEPVAESRTWTERHAVNTETPKLTIRNIWGNVRIRPGSPGAISITIDEKRSAPSRALFARSLETLKLDVDAGADGVSIWVGEPDRRWRRHDPCEGCRVDYQFDVSVPPGTQLDVGTVTDGRVDVAGIVGSVSARNVNGPIVLSDLRDCRELESVNGAVEVSFAMAPGQDCSIQTVNGDVTLAMPGGSGLDVALDVFNGSIFTEFSADSYALPAQVDRSVDAGRQRYTVKQSAGLRLEGGGPRIAISSLNGDIRFQKNQ